MGIRPLFAFFPAVALGLCQATTAVAQPQGQAKEQAKNPNAPALEARSSTRAPSGTLEEVIVTGVFRATDKSAASIAVSTIGLDAIAEVQPVSAADLLRLVPSVFVNSAFGEIRNIVNSRGISANSNEAGSGYYYVSLQEDGLPVTNVTYGNYGPDFLVRPDVTLANLQGLRGGTAVITGANAPGGIFNYISKNGKTNPGGELRLRYGLEADGHGPQRRVDLYYGGDLGNNWYYSLGGFYRTAQGARDIGYDFNKGGQIRVNLLKELENGSVEIYAKYLDDHNGFFEFLPAFGFEHPHFAPGFTNTDTILPPPVTFDFPALSARNSQDPSSTLKHFDSTNLAHTISTSGGVKFNYDFGDGWSLTNHARFSANRIQWNAGAYNAPQSLTDPRQSFWIPFTAGQTGFGTNAMTGIYNFIDPRTGQSRAQLFSLFGAVNTLLPGNTLPGSAAQANSIIFQPMLYFYPRTDEFMDQASVTKQFDEMSFTFGVFSAHSRNRNEVSFAGMGFGTLEPNPTLFNIQFTPTDFFGVPAGAPVQQLTNPQGIAAIGNGMGNNSYTATQNDLALFFGHDWKLSEHFTMDWGVRYESVQVKGTNVATSALVPINGGAGFDNDPNTIYDNTARVPDQSFAYDKTVDTFNYTGALTYSIDDRSSVYMRYAAGKKAPDLGFYVNNYTSDIALQFVEPVAQKIRQLELGYKLSTPTLTLAATPFASWLDNVPVPSLFINTETNPPSGVNATPIYNSLRTYGIELEGDYFLTTSLNLHAVITAQNSKATKYLTYRQIDFGPELVILDTSGQKADNTPDLITNLSVQHRWHDLSSIVTWKYLGSRPASAGNAFTLPGFSQFDVAFTYDPTPNLQFQLNVNNVLDEFGAMSFYSPGGFPNATSRNYVTREFVEANPNASYQVLSIQPRAYYLTAVYKF